MDFNGSGSLEMRYLNGPTGDLVDTVIARESAGGMVAWYLPDRLGTVRDLINNSGAIIDHVDYSAFGTQLDESSPSNGDRMMGFGGMERDAVTGLNLAVNRVQNPGTGRWSSQDPLGFAAGDADLYRYVGNSPTDYADTSGEALPRVWVNPGGGMLYGVDRGGEIFGGFEIHVYKNGKEVAKIKGNGGYCKTHGNTPLMSPSQFRQKYGDEAYKQLKQEIKQRAIAAKKAGWSGALGATSALLMFMMEGYAQGLEIAAAENSAYQQLVAALARGDLAEANRQADEFYMDLLTRGGGAAPALTWKNAWETAICEASKGSGD
jgi:RHS repeat-associated protein